MLLNEIKQAKNKWKAILCSWTARPTIVTMSVLPRPIYKFMVIPTKIPTALLKKNPKIHVKSQGPPNIQNNLEKQQHWRAHPS